MRPLKQGIRSVLKCCFLVLLVSHFSISAFAQTKSIPPLERTVSFSVRNAETREVLNQVPQQADIIFSYSSEAFKPVNNIDLMVDNKPVRCVLNSLFQGSVNYKTKGKYIILTANRDFAVAPAVVGKKRTIEGYITEPISGKKICGVTIYDRNSMASTTTNEYGYFKLTLPDGATNPDVKVSKAGYLGTALNQTKDAFSFIAVNLSLDSLKQSLGLQNLGDEIDSIRIFPKWLVSKKLSLNTKNVKDTLSRRAQVSFLPYVGTNQLLSGNVENDYSFNVVAGYVQGLRKAVVAGVLNIVRDSVRYFQLAGVANIVGKNARGVQIAGAFNKTQSMNGVQVAGVLNVASEKSQYVQLSGVGNISGKSHEGIQYAGVFNYANSLKGVQVASVANAATEVRGVQLSEVLNYAKVVNGAQIANVANYADSVSGFQLCMVFNKARFIKGLQLGLVNIADTCSGVPIGLFSYVRKGYHNIELSCDDIFYGNAAFRSGVQALHSIMFVGMRPSSGSDPLWTYGFGLGSTMRIRRNLYFDADITSQQLLKGDVLLKNSYLYKGYFGLEQKLSAKCSIAAGGTFNFMVFDSTEPNSVKYLSTLVPHTIMDKPNGKGYTHQTWLGWKVAFRFF